MRRPFKIVSLICVFALLMSVGGVFATWHYATLPMQQADDTVSIIMFPWDYTGEGGHDHQWLIEAIINGEVNGEKVGLNGAETTKVNTSWGIPEAADGSELNQEIAEYATKNRNYLGSMGTLAANKLENLFKARSGNVKWILYFPNGYQKEEGNTIYLFTTSETIAKSNGRPIGGYIHPIYRTTITFVDGEWKQMKIQSGYAQSDEYKEKYTGSWLTNVAAWNPATWGEGLPPS